MNDNIVENCVVCNTDKSIDNFFKYCRECRAAIFKRVLKRYFNKKGKLLQQRRDKYACLKDLDNRLKALEENINLNNTLT